MITPKQLIEVTNAAAESTVDWHRITPQESAWAYLIAERASKIARDLIAQSGRADLIEPDTMLAHMDILLTHLSRGLDLVRWYEANDLEFMEMYAAVELTLRADPRFRTCGFFPADVPLRFVRVTH